MPTSGFFRFGHRVMRLVTFRQTSNRRILLRRKPFRGTALRRMEVAFGDLTLGEMTTVGEIAFGEMTFGDLTFGEMTFGEVLGNQPT